MDTLALSYPSLCSFLIPLGFILLTLNFMFTVLQGHLVQLLKSSLLIGIGALCSCIFVHNSRS